MSETRMLSVLDKINIAACAAQRAKDNCLNNERFKNEFSTVLLWKNHSILHLTTSNGGLLFINTSW